MPKLEIRVPRDKKTTKRYPRKIQDIKRKSGIADSTVNVPKRHRELIEDGEVVVRVDVLYKDEEGNPRAIIFEHGGLVPIKCPYCNHIYTDDDLKELGDSGMCVGETCQIQVDIVPPKKPYPFEYHSIADQTRVIPNYDPRIRSVITVLPPDAELREIGLMDVVFRTNVRKGR